MSGRRGRPTGDRYEEPGGYDPAAMYQGEPQADPGAPGPGYGEQAFAPAGEHYGEPYGGPAGEAYGGPHPGGGHAEPGRYAQPAEHGGYGYPQPSYAGPDGSPESYPAQGYAPESYAPEPYAQGSYPQESPAQAYAEPVPSGPGGGYGYPDAPEMSPALAEPGRDAYGSGYPDQDGATSVLPAIVEPLPEAGTDHSGGYGAEVDHYDAGPTDYAGTDYSGADYAGTDHDADHEPDAAGATDLDRGRDLEHAGGTGRRAARVPAQRTGEPSTRAARTPRTPRTPIWDPPGMLPALCTVGLAAVLAATAIAGKPALVLGVAFLQVLTAAGWFRLNGMWPARQGIALVVLAAFATDIAVYAKGEQGLASVPAVLACTLLVVLALQARSGARPGELLPALTVTTSAALIAAFDVAYLVAGDLEGGPIDAGAAVVAAVLAAGVATLVRAVPLPPAVAPIPSWLLGTAAGAGAGIALGGEAPYAALLGAGAAALALLGRRIAGYDHPSRFVHFTAGVSLPLALAAPAAYLLGRVMIG
ncbi:hypothetical protein [Embleya sp. NPDC001921]